MNFPVGRHVVEIDVCDYELPAAWGPDGQSLVHVDSYWLDDCDLNERREEESL